MSSSEHFKDSFWSPSAAKEDIPNYTKGLRVLYERLNHSVQENKVISNFLRNRIDNELQCARSLAIDVDAISMNAGLKDAFDMVCQESMESAHYHRTRAGVLTQDVLQPLVEFTRIFEDQIQYRKNTMEDEISAFEHTAQTALLLRAVYWSKCRTLELACPEFRPPLPEGFEEEDADDDNEIGNNDEFVVGGADGRRRRSSSVTSELNVDQGGVRLGKCTVLPYREIARSMNRLKSMLEGTKSSTTEGSRKFLGKDIFEWVRDFMATVQRDVTLDTESQEICQQLVALKFLRSVPKETSGFTLGMYYEVQQNVLDRYIRKIRIRKSVDHGLPQVQEFDHHQTQNMTLEVPLSNSGGPVGVFNGFFGKFKSTKIRTAAHIEMNESNEAYRKKIKLANRLRRELEESMSAYFDEMEQLEKNRIHSIKLAFKTMATTLSDTLPMFKGNYDRIALFQEALKPEQDVQSIIEQYKTGYFCPKPFVYENYYHGSAIDQIFGVPLEEVTQIYGSYVPPIISKGIKLIESGLAVKSSYKDKEQACEMVWSIIVPLKKMNAYCRKLDSLAGTQLKEELETYNMNVLANLIRVYLLELPECLLTFDLYDPIKSLYATQQDTTSRLSLVSKLLMTLPPPNYHTLKALSFHLFKLLKQTSVAADDMLNKLISMFAYILMRPRTSSATNVHDRHPKKLVRDLFTQYHSIFTTTTKQEKHHVKSISTGGGDKSYFVSQQQRPKINNMKSAHSSSFPTNDSNDTLALRRTLSTIMPRSSVDSADENCYSPGGSLVLPHARMTLLFDDLDHSRPIQLKRLPVVEDNNEEVVLKRPVDAIDQVDKERLSTDVNLILSTDDEDDFIGNPSPRQQKRAPNRSRASTRGSLDNVVLDSFFDD